MTNKIRAVYFSPTNTTEKITKNLAKNMGDIIGCLSSEINITNHALHKEKIAFTETEALILGFPVYGGRIPGFLDSFMHDLKGENTPAVVVAVYGNRDFDDAIMEMKDALSERGFNVVAAAGFIGEHSFSSKLAPHRPDEADMEKLAEFAGLAADKIMKLNQGETLGDFDVKGSFPYKERSSSVPAFPKTAGSCTDCKICSDICPMGAIDKADPSAADESSCIKCFACVKACPAKAKYFDDENVVKAIAWLEGNFKARKEPEFFV